MFFDTSNIYTQQLENKLFAKNEVDVSIVRLDQIHPVVSGNKLFKLHYFIEECLKTTHKTIATFGGAYSNHLVATAYSCQMMGLKSIGIVRGQKPLKLSHTLEQCIAYGMRLIFISREDYTKKDNNNFINGLVGKRGNFTLIPEGGFHPLGTKGASLIMRSVDKEATHICAATGTATTIAGLVLSAATHQQIVGINVLKGITDTNERISFLTGNKTDPKQLRMLNDYHFGGYSKQSPELIAFMNDLYQQYQLPTDFVYTAKMLFAVFDSIAKGLFPKGSKISCLHTGGLQGNLSLPYNTLIF
jgi:1-aminocyclopropane-1-carboxylate deaminase/D-cysteine desulfhydrase-like pyridoxal-dependent ACC family enzyme